MNCWSWQKINMSGKNLWLSGVTYCTIWLQREKEREKERQGDDSLIKFNVPLDTKQVIWEMLVSANISASSENERLTDLTHVNTVLFTEDQRSRWAYLIPGKCIYISYDYVLIIQCNEIKLNVRCKSLKFQGQKSQQLKTHTHTHTFNSLFPGQPG